jgi:protein involved in polysaccharide export with SLBB domain
MKSIRIILPILFITMGLITKAQVNNLRIENMTDEQIVMVLKQYNLLGLTEAELEQKASEKGLPPDQIKAIRKRLATIDPQMLLAGNTSNAPTKQDAYTQRNYLPSLGPVKKMRDSSLQVFGADLFDADNAGFDVNLSIATPTNYVLGPNDELVIDIFGVSESTRKIKINTEGYLRIPNLGPIKISGLTMEQATQKIRQFLTAIYPAIKSGQTRVAVSLGQIRSIRVTMIGEVQKPGSYSLPSLATILHALYASGGPNTIGSYRNIQLVRNGNVVSYFDLYDFLFKGDLRNNLLLQDDDVIRIPAYIKRVAVKGAVKRQAIFDAKEEDAASLLDYAGGLSDLAQKELIRIKRLGTSSREVLTVKINEAKGFRLMSGDTLEVDSLAGKYLNRLMVSGAVYYPGTYGLSGFPTLRALLKHVQPKENAYIERGIIRRLNSDLSPTLIPFNLTEVLTGKNDLSLQKEDSIHLFEKEKIRENYFVKIEGEVNDPNAYTYAEGMKVQDLILMAKGLKDGATLQRIEVSRRMRQGSGNSDTSIYAVIQTIDVDPRQFNMSSLDLPLQPYDIIYIRKSPIYKEQTNVVIEGEVLYPGKYTLEGANERLSKLIERAGGIRSTAFPEGAMLIRKTFQGTTSNDSTIFGIKYELISNKNKQVNLDAGGKSADTSQIAQQTKQIFASQKRVAIDLNKALQKPNSADDIVLLEGDILKIPRIQQTVQSFGEVNYPQQMAFTEGMRFRQLINASGGFSTKALRKRAYVLEASGKVRSTTHFLFLRFYPRISAGSEVYVPMRKDREPLSKGEAIGITSGLVSLAGVMLAIINSIK